MDLIAHQYLAITDQQVNCHVEYDCLIFHQKAAAYLSRISQLWIHHYGAGHSQLALALLIQHLFKSLTHDKTMKYTVLLSTPSSILFLDTTVLSKEVIALIWLFPIFAYVIQQSLVAKITSAKKDP